MTESKIVDVKGNHFEMSEGYEGAGSSFGRQLENWGITPLSADGALLPSFDSGNARAADLARNDGYAKNGVQLHVDHIVGHQFKLVYKPNYRLLGLESKELKEFIKDVEAKFTNFAEDTRCYIDAERKRTFTMIIREAIATHCKTGEIMAKAEWFKKRGSKFKTSIKLIDYARVSNPNGAMNTHTLRAGVKSDKHGAAVGYHVRKSHPTDSILTNFDDMYSWVYVPRELPWGRTQMIHLFEPDGENQSRGANAFFASLSKLKMLDKFQATTLQNAIVNAMYAAVIESDMSTEEVFKAIGSEEGKSSSILNRFMQVKADYHEAAGIKLGGVKIAHLLPSEKLILNSAGKNGVNAETFESGILRYIAKSLGVSYEQLSGDFSKTNYSSARAAMSESLRYFMGKREIIAKRLANHIFELWFEEAITLGEIVLPKGAPSFWEAKSAWVRSNWIGAGKTQIDGLKGIKEAIEKIRAGLSTYEIEFGNQGLDYMEMFDQQDRETEELAARGRLPLWMMETLATESDDDDDDDDDNDEKPKKSKKKEMNENPEVHDNDNS